jgi:radical SAM protein with 4Fe4S-binding SPASM domain
MTIFKRFIIRVRNYVVTRGLRISFFLKLKRIPFLPNTIDLEPTNLCNLRCSHCPNQYWTKKKKNLRLEQFEEIIKQFPNLKYIKLQGIGEPFLNPALFDMLHKAESLGMHAGVTTNGMVYNDAVSEGVKKLKATHLKISIDAVSDENLQALRTGSRIGTIETTIARLKGDNKLLADDLSIWTVVTNRNVHELPAIIGFGKRTTIGSITLQMFLNDYSIEEIRNVVLGQKIQNLSAFRSELDHVKVLAKNENIRLEFYTGNYFTRQHQCPWPFTTTFIDVEGNVVPCCNISDAAVATMGNVFERPFREIWNSREYRQFREDIRTHHLRDYCRKCYSE